MNYLEKLKKILAATSWTQEELARQLQVSFPALNAWINERSVPRQSALARIDELYLVVIGVDQVDPADLSYKKDQAMRAKLSARAVIKNAALLEKLTILLTYHTNTIEGSTMTMVDVEGVLFQNKVLGNRTAIEQAEARNHQAALNWLLDKIAESRTFVVSEEVIRGLHLRLMNGIVSDAGQYRKHSVRIMGAHVPLANWQSIRSLLDEFVSFLQEDDSQDLIAKLAKSHAVFEQIHPFSDGNGRTGRLLILAQALSAGSVPPIIVKERKRAYYKCLELAQINHDYQPLELFMADSILNSQELLMNPGV